MKLKINNIMFSYASSAILKDICMELAPSEVLGIVGPNGSGKSTLIRCVDRILKPQKGSIVLDEKDICKMSRMEIARLLGYVPQSSAHTFPATVFDTVLMGRRPHLGWRSSQGDTEKVWEALRLLQIEKFAMREFNEISGGEQQRVLMARALAQEADVLLLDEPTSSLDVRHQLEVMEIVRKLVDEKSLSAIVAIHDLNLAARYCDRIVMLKKGNIHIAGDPFSVLTTENVEAVYGIESFVSNDSDRPYIIPIRPVCY